MGPTLSWLERCHYRDRLRGARYSALADAEGFGEVCFALEAIGMRLLRQEGQLGSYIRELYELAKDSDVLHHVATEFPVLFASFSALYRTVQNARNDAMHSGVYARHATEAAIALCIALEEALMKEQDFKRVTVGDFMVRSPVAVQPWQPVAYARQLMLTHSFSFLPVKIDHDWLLLPEVSVAKFLHRKEKRKELLAKEIREVGGLKESGAELELVRACLVSEASEVDTLLAEADASVQTLWLVDDGHGGLAGVLSPFELM
ncbi:CBS domain-containing protein [Cupriavidus sp. SW-Y-13]|uniref:CBS domain-containing protein n=1 Tax=Cupriavidus sp. SW-Y-13 TaxID=2653854 RepID=UPI001365C1A4|nr:CBS domain-containing protein [Cupriavidus sp. SW-Y-13]MWL88596.1 hypothetical protein [Cupriavidus sp. SW-Y-13]